MKNEEMNVKKVLTISGSDCSGGSGLQADYKTFSAHKVYGTCAVTALVSQNSKGVYAIQPVDPDFMSSQLDSILSEMVPDAVKIGMIPNKELVAVIARKLKEYNVRNIVLDPVVDSTFGQKLVEYDVITSMITQLIPITAVITPNMAEAKLLCGLDINTKDDMLEAAAKIQEIVFVPILITGGDLIECSDDLLYYGGEVYWFKGPQLDTINTQGAGCSLASAIAANLALDQTLEQSIRLAKVFITGAIGASIDLGTGVGAVNHGWNSR